MSQAGSLSQPRLDANKANAQRSTGPKTEQGKAKAAQNGLNHGLTAKRLIIRTDEREEFTQFLMGWVNDIQPKGSVETAFFNQMVDADWNFRRAGKLEAQLGYKCETDPLASPDPEIRKQAIVLARYKTTHQRAFRTAYKELAALQNHRLQREAAMAAMAETLAENPITNQTQPDPLNVLAKLMADIAKEEQTIFAGIAGFSSGPNITNRNVSG